jgi:hypothetical protein
MPAAIYLLSALVLQLATGHPFPLLSGAAWIAFLNVVLLTLIWSGRGATFVALGSMVTLLVWLRLVRTSARPLSGGLGWRSSPELWPTAFGFSFADLAVIVLAGLACFWLAIAMISRQRQGGLSVPARKPGAGWTHWLIDRVRVACPVSSPMRAQAWFEFKSGGLPLLAVAVMLALMILVLFAISGPVDVVLHDHFHLTCEKVHEQRCFMLRGMSWMFGMFSPLILFGLAGNALGARWGRGRLGSFDATLACDTARLAALKVVVRWMCVVAALLIVELSVWSAMSLFGTETFLQVTNVSLRAFHGAVARVSGFRLLAVLFALLMLSGLCVAAMSVLGVLWVRYSGRVNRLALVMLLFILMVVALGLASKSGSTLAMRAGIAVANTAGWVFAGTVIFVTARLLWRGIADRLLNGRYVCGAVLITAAFVAAWMTILGKQVARLGELPAAATAFLLALLLLPLLASVLTPWAYSRIRHL